MDFLADLFADQLAQFEPLFTETPAPLILLTGALVFLLSWLASGWQKVQRCRTLTAALNDSSRGRIVVERGPTRWGFFARIQPPPEPFTQFTINYRSGSKLSLFGWLFPTLASRSDRMVISGRLRTRPHAELVWVRGQIPGRALGKRPSATLWELRRLDITNGEYATRGINPRGLVHFFVDLQARFEPFLEKVVVQADELPEVQVVVRPAGLNADEVPALVTTIRAAGRAALLE
jgi:hypothetical protein